jgi:hypothetical protein
MKLKLLMAFLLVGILATTFVSATTCSGPIVCGKVYLQGTDPLQIVSGASVSVDCNDNVLAATTSNEGQYCVCYASDECSADDTVEVTATKGSSSGSNTGVVENGWCGLDIAIVDVFIPEFSAIAAGVALIGSGIGFLALRRKK